MSQKFKKADVVRLKSGGPEMTVLSYRKPIDFVAAAYRTEPKDMGEGVVVHCQWFNGNKLEGNDFHQDLLDLVTSAPEQS